MKNLFLPGLLLAFTLNACDHVDCITANGAAVERTIELPPITGVASHGSIEVVLTRGETQRVVARGPQEILALIKTDVDKGILNVRTEGCYTTRQPVVVEITLPELTHASVAGSGNITGKSLFQPGELDLEVSGSGNIQLEVNSKDIEADVAGSGSIMLRGTTGELEVSVAGSGNLKAFELAANTAEVRVAGSGNAEMNVIDTLKVRVAGSGNVRYKGQPHVTSDITGSGSVSAAQ